jgi:lipoprotein-releasing system permease protein
MKDESDRFGFILHPSSFILGLRCSLYKLLLCWRYLLTRYLPILCVGSVMLGVATLIVVNSVMSGFSTKLKERLHGLLSDVVIESTSYDGFPDPDEKMRRIAASPVGDKIAAMTPTVEVFAMVQFQFRGEWITRPVHLIGIDPKGRTQVGSFSQYLMNQKDATTPSFMPSPEAVQRYRRLNPPMRMPDPPLGPDGKPAPAPWVRPQDDALPTGIILGNGIVSFRDPKSEPGHPKDIYVLQPGDRVTLLTATINIPTTDGAQKLQPVRLDCVVADFFKSEMSEYDSNYVYVPLEYLQEMRMMNAHGEHRATSIQIKLKDYRDAELVTKTLRNLFPEQVYQVHTWEEKQGPLLEAISIEKGILNVLLFMIIAVAGFGILAIFSMIVAEKTKDIGILKALGASNWGVMGIFLGYGLLLGLVGTGLGTALGLTITNYINEIEHFLTETTGHEVFSRGVYYFDAIPTDVQPVAVGMVNLGALAVAVLFSVLPALRAASLHPVRALRYE